MNGTIVWTYFFAAFIIHSIIRLKFGVHLFTFNGHEPMIFKLRPPVLQRTRFDDGDGVLKLYFILRKTCTKQSTKTHDTNFYSTHVVFAFVLRYCENLLILPLFSIFSRFAPNNELFSRLRSNYSSVDSIRSHTKDNCVIAKNHIYYVLYLY